MESLFHKEICEIRKISKNLVNPLTWYHLCSNSTSGLLKKPPTSAPQKLMPPRASERHMGILTPKCDHSAALSPVHTIVYLWEPAKCDLVKMNGLRLLVRFSKPLYVAMVWTKHIKKIIGTAKIKFWAKYVEYKKYIKYNNYWIKVETLTMTKN